MEVKCSIKKLSLRILVGVLFFRKISLFWSNWRRTSQRNYYSDQPRRGGANGWSVSKNHFKMLNHYGLWSVSNSVKCNIRSLAKYREIKFTEIGGKI